MTFAALLITIFIGCNNSDSSSSSGESSSRSSTTGTGTGGQPGDGSETNDGASSKDVSGGEQTGEQNGDKPSDTGSGAKSIALKQKVIDVGFEGLVFNLQADVVFREGFMPEAIKELDGKKIRVQGYMYGGVKKRTGIQKLILLRNTECKFGPGGQADHLVKVQLLGDLKTDFSTKLVTVEGVLSINPYTGPDGNTWSLYDLDCDTIKVSRW